MIRWLLGPRLAVVVAGYALVVLWLYGRVGAGGHLALALATWALLVLALVPRSDLWRARTLVVVAMATVGELVGSQLLGLYEYRVGSIPGFVPPGHGLVFLAGCGLAEAQALRRHADHFVAAVCAVALAWALVGASHVAAPDLAGALGAAVFVAIVLAAPRNLRPYYAGVFIVVSLLEIAGTALGAWRWADTSSLLGLPAGNPPSGVASGYCLFGLAGFTLAPLLVAKTRARTMRRSAAQLVA